MGCGPAFSVSPAQRFLKVCRRAKRWHRTSDASSVGRRVHWRPEYIQARGHRASSHPQQSEGTLTSGTTGGSSSRGTSMGPCCCPYEYAWEGAELRTGCPLRTLLHQPFLTAASWSPGLLWGCPSQGQPAPCCSAGHQHVISSHILFPTAATLALCPGPYPPDQLPDSLILDSTPKAPQLLCHLYSPKLKNVFLCLLCGQVRHHQVGIHSAQWSCIHLFLGLTSPRCPLLPCLSSCRCLFSDGDRHTQLS